MDLAAEYELTVYKLEKEEAASGGAQTNTVAETKNKTQARRLILSTLAPSVVLKLGDDIVTIKAFEIMTGISTEFQNDTSPQEHD